MGPEFPEHGRFEFKDFGNGLCICAKDKYGQYWIWPKDTGYRGFIDGAVPVDKFQSWIHEVLSEQDVEGRG